MWTDEAAEVLSENMDDGQDFLFVSEATQGMHWLYTFHYEVDPYGERGIIGHWRADITDWEDETGERNTTGVEMNLITTLTHHDTGTSTKWRNDPGMQTAFEEATPTHRHMERARAHQREHDNEHPATWHTSVPHELVYIAHSLAADGKHNPDAWDWDWEESM